MQTKNVMQFLIITVATLLWQGGDNDAVAT